MCVHNGTEGSSILVTRYALTVGVYEPTKEIVSDSSASDDRKDKVCLRWLLETTPNTPKNEDDARCRS